MCELRKILLALVTIVAFVDEKKLVCSMKLKVHSYVLILLAFDNKKRFLDNVSFKVIQYFYHLH